MSQAAAVSHGHAHHEEAGFISTYLFSTDHKMIGIQYLITGLCFLFLPARLLDRLFIWRQSALSALMFWRR